MALVREAVTLSGLEGLGVPRVVAFGSLPGSARRYLVRELVDGRSLEDVMEHGDGEWLRPIACAADQLTVLHRAGLFHGDIKPANVIVGDDGMGTLVDLGLATPWREGGARAKGLTPKYAAPELLIGDAAHRARRGLCARRDARRRAHRARRRAHRRSRARPSRRIATRATEEDPQARYPEHRRARERAEERSAPRDARVRRGRRVARARPRRRGAGAHRGGRAPRAGRSARGRRTTSAADGRRSIRRLSWSLGVSGAPVANVEPGRAARPAPRAPSRRARSSSSSSACGAASTRPSRVWSWSSTISRASTTKRDAALKRAVRARRTHRRGRRRGCGRGSRCEQGHVRVFQVPPLDDVSASELVKRAVPSLPDRLARHLLERVQRRPGLLRSFVKRLGGRAVTSIDEIDEIVDASSRRSVPPSSRSREDGLTELRRALDTGRFDLAVRDARHARTSRRTTRRRSTSRSRARRSCSRAATR